MQKKGVQEGSTLAPVLKSLYRGPKRGWLVNPQFRNASHLVSCTTFTKVCVAHINYLEIS